MGTGKTLEHVKTENNSDKLLVLKVKPWYIRWMHSVTLSWQQPQRQAGVLTVSSLLLMGKYLTPDVFQATSLGWVNTHTLVDLFWKMWERGWDYLSHQSQSWQTHRWEVFTLWKLFLLSLNLRCLENKGTVYDSQFSCMARSQATIWM